MRVLPMAQRVTSCPAVVPEPSAVEAASAAETCACEPNEGAESSNLPLSLAPKWQIPLS